MLNKGRFGFDKLSHRSFQNFEKPLKQCFEFLIMQFNLRSKKAAYSAAFCLQRLNFASIRRHERGDQ